MNQFRGVARGFIAAICLILSLTNYGFAEDRISLATSGLGDGELPIFVALTSKLFAKEGIVAERLQFQSGGAAIQAFTGGSADLCICAADHVLRLNNRGYKARILVGLDAHFPSLLVVRDDSKIASLADLKGKKIGITSPGASTDNIIRWEIGKLGLDADKDFQLISIGYGAPMLTALKTGAIDAGILNNGEITISQSGGSIPLKVVIDWRKLEDAALVIIGRQEWVDKNSDLARRVVRALTEALRLIQKDPAAAETAIRAIFPNLPDEQTRKIARSTAERLSKDGSVSADAYRTMTDIVIKSDPTVKPVEQALVDLFPALSKP